MIYEACPALQKFSDGMLCSYNRLTDGETSLESFGDADGDRFDLYRCFRLRERGPLPERFEEAYLIEVQEFVDCVLQNKAPGVSVYDGTKSTAIGYATTEAWRTGKAVKI